MMKAIVFVQSFVWATLLIRKPSRIYFSLAGSFLLLFILYLLQYISAAYEKAIPLNMLPAFTLLLSISVSFFQLRKLRLSYIKNRPGPAWILLAASILMAGYCFWTGIPLKKFWTYILLFGAATFAYDTYAMIKGIRKLTLTSSMLEDKPSRLSLLLLLDKLLVLLLACFILFVPDKNAQISSALRNFLDMLIAVLAFITGYMAVTATFPLEGQRKRKNKTHVNGGNSRELIEKLTRLMEDQRPYLDSELSLTKMADMLDIGENELTRLLNQEMNTNFYTLINDYRMEAVLKKLKASDKRKYTIMASAYESGFNSKSTFYRIFKEYTKLTPKEYLADS